MSHHFALKHGMVHKLNDTDLMSPPGGEKAKHCSPQYLLSSCISSASTAATPAPRLWPVITRPYSCMHKHYTLDCLHRPLDCTGLIMT